MNHLEHTKLSVICKHPQDARVVIEEETNDPCDSGKIYACAYCEKHIGGDISYFDTMCEKCIEDVKR